MSCKTITVFSSKGGVGKTLVAVNVATALALAKHKVLIIDFDLQAGQDMARMLNLMPSRAILDLLPALGASSSDAEVMSPARDQTCLQAGLSARCQQYPPDRSCDPR